MATNNKEEDFKAFFTREFSDVRFQNDEVCDITGFDGRSVVGQLSVLINRRGRENDSARWYKKETSFFKIEKPSADVVFFKIVTDPKIHQPGNGVVIMRPKGAGSYSDNRKPYLTINNLLKSHYGKDTASFAKHTQTLFLDNESIARVPEITAEVYMILLFEIARRFVEGNPFGSLLKANFDNLPIGLAVAKIVKLFQEDKAIGFSDVFTHGGCYHIFTGSAEKRQENINNINERYKWVVKSTWSELDELGETFGYVPMCNEESEPDLGDESDDHNDESEHESEDNWDESNDSSDGIDYNGNESEDESDESEDNRDQSDDKSDESDDESDDKSDESDDESDESDDKSDESEDDSDESDG